MGVRKTLFSLMRRRLDPYERVSLKSFSRATSRNPLRGVIGLLWGAAASDLYALSRLLGSSLAEVFSYYEEIAGDRWFLSMLKDKLLEAFRLERVGGYIDFTIAPMLYVIVRILRPSIVVETGVGPGASSAFILRALEVNGFGKLYSIDLPEADHKIYLQLKLVKETHHYSPHGWNPGWLVPEELRWRWELILDDARQVLPRLLSKLGKIDMFLHDSLHTYEHMIFEYSIAYRYIRDGGVLASDDANWNSAFRDFCASKMNPYIITLTAGGRLGVMVKKLRKRFDISLLDL